MEQKSWLRKSMDMPNSQKMYFLILAHLPFVAFLAPIGYGTEMFAISASVLIGILATAGYFLLKDSRAFGSFSAILIMLISATLIQTQLGRIEMHFHIFVGLAFLLIFKDYIAILVGAVVGAIHHVLLTFVQLNEVVINEMPIMLFNYGCSWSITFLHAFFVVIEAAVLVYYAFSMREEEEISISTQRTIYDIQSSFDFSKRVQGYQDSPSVIAFNTLLTSLESAFSKIHTVLSDVSDGNMSARMDGQYEGDLFRLQTSLNEAVSRVGNTMNSLQTVMGAIENGDFSVRMDSNVPTNFKTSVDDALKKIDGAMSEIMKVLVDISKGEFSTRVEGDLQGNLAEMKKQINASMNNLETAMNEISVSAAEQSNGNLSARISGNYQGGLAKLKEAFNNSSTKIGDIISQVKQAAINVNQTSQELSGASLDLNDRTQNQAAALEETAASLEEMTSTIRQNAESTRMAEELSDKAKIDATKGQKLMDASISAVEGIRQSSTEIEQIISIIDSIAFQTNLLALNAAVEAARAGEHGRGFAVVAGEVRTLAGKSADAAKQIKDLIDKSVSEINDGTSKIKETGENLEQINGSILKVAEIIREISLASGQQLEGMEQISSAVTQIDKNTQQNAALVEETTAASDTLKSDSQELMDSVSGFVLEDTKRIGS